MADVERARNYEGEQGLDALATFVMQTRPSAIIAKSVYHGVNCNVDDALVTLVPHYDVLVLRAGTSHVSTQS